jgi:NADH-quinone oxidoreductase subunit A
MLESQHLWPLGFYLAAVIFVVAAMLGVSAIAGGRRSHDPASPPYESGMLPVGRAGARLSISYYLVAMFFLIFDLEAVFVFAWAVAVRQAGWAGYSVMAVFIATLMTGFFFLWRRGALDTGGRPRGKTSARIHGVLHECSPPAVDGGASAAARLRESI